MTQINDAPTLADNWPTAGILAPLKAAASSHTWAAALSDTQAEALDVYALNQYGDRRLNKLGQTLPAGETTLLNIMLTLYGTKWDRLYTDYTAEYNPIWNVDGSSTETETRNLSAMHTGTDTTAASGTDTLKHTGTDTTAAGGTDTHRQTGTDTTAAGGTDTHRQTGTDTTAASGKDTGTQTGTETTDHSGSDTRTVTNNTYGYNSAEGVPADSSSETVSKNTQDKLTLDTTSATEYGRTDTNTKNLTDSTEYGRTDTNTKNLTDSTEYGRTDTNTKDLTDSTEYGRTDTNTKNLTDTDTGTITRETKRGGNIGVTMTQQMLQADLDYWTQDIARFYNMVILDIINEISYKIAID